MSTKTSADYAVLACWAVTKKEQLLFLDLQRSRMEGPDIVPALQRIYKQWRPATVGIDSVAFEPSIVQQARRVGLPKRELRPDKDKVSRAYTAAARMEGGGVFFRRESPTSESLEAALLKFPAGRHHDMVDMPSYVIAEVIQQRRLPFDVEDGSAIVPRDYWLRP